MYRNNTIHELNYTFKLALKFVLKVIIYKCEKWPNCLEKVWSWCECVVSYKVSRKLWIMTWTMSSIAKRHSMAWILFNILNKTMKIFKHIPPSASPLKPFKVDYSFQRPPSYYLLLYFVLYLYYSIIFIVKGACWMTIVNN